MTKKKEQLSEKARIDAVQPQNENFSVKPRTEQKKTKTLQMVVGQPKTTSVDPQQDNSLKNTPPPPIEK